MPYRYRRHDRRDDVEYFEPEIGPECCASDIADYILALAEPSRSICRAIVLNGENIGKVAALHGLSRQRVGKILRTSLLPLAEDFEIVPRRR